MQNEWGRSVVLLAALALGCSGGGDDSADDPTSVFGGSTNLVASFTPAVANPGPRSVALAVGGTNANLITLQVRVAEVEDVFGADFVLRFDPAAVEFLSWSPGELLETGGAPVVYLVTPQADRLVVGMSRTSPPTGANATNSHTLIHLTFRVTAAGSSPVTLESSALLDSQPPAPEPISGVSWFGGQFLAN